MRLRTQKNLDKFPKGDILPTWDPFSMGSFIANSSVGAGKLQWKVKSSLLPVFDLSVVLFYVYNG